jgi:hypothetical protein
LRQQRWNARHAARAGSPGGQALDQGGAVATGKLPSSTIVRLPGGPLQARLDLTLAEWALLCRVDGRRPVSALANRSGRGHHEAIALAERLLAAGLIELAGNADEAGPPPRRSGTVGAEVDDGPGTTSAAEAVAAAELTGLTSPDAGEGIDEENDQLAAADPEAAAEEDLAVAIEPSLDDGGSLGADSLVSQALPGPAEGAAAGGDPGAEAEPTGATPTDGVTPAGEPAGPGEEGGGREAAPGRERIDPVSLLRELAADAAEAPAATEEPEAGDGDGEDLAELAARLAGGRQPDEERADQPAGEDRRQRDEPARAPGRGASQAEFLREFASLAMGDDPTDDPEPGPQPDDEPLDDERGRGRFGFRRGQRR